MAAMLAGANGSAFYRDVPLGPYHIAPESFGRDCNQYRNVGLPPDQHLYVKIVSLDICVMSVSCCMNCARVVFFPRGNPAGDRASRKSLATAPAFDGVEVSVCPHEA